MDQDKDFAIRPGRIKTTRKGITPGRAYVNRVLKAANLARGGAPSSSGRARSPSFTGARIGRGAGAGAVLASRVGVSRFRQRRVLVKARIVKLAGKGIGAARAHMHYVQRDGVTRDGQPGELYSADQDRADGRAFIDRSEDDRHQFRFIVSPEDGAQYDDLKDVTRRLMARMEQDLDTRLDWVAVDHFNTGHPHTHVVVRGRDDQDKDLVIARNYIADGIRERAAEIVSLDLGPRTEHEIDQSLKAEMTQDRFTTIDRWLIERKDENGLVAAVDGDGRRQSLLAGRLNHLEELGLARPIGNGVWTLDENAEGILRVMGRRGDIINSLSYDLAQDGQAHLLHDAIIHDGSRGNAIDTTGASKVMIGQLVRRGLFDEDQDRHYMVVNATDGRTHVIDIGDGERTPAIPEGAVISLSPNVAKVKQVDIRISQVAALNGGIYSIDRHLDADPTATEAYATTHVRRLEAVRRTIGGVERLADGSFQVGSKYLDTADLYERLRTDQQPARIEVLSLEPPQRQVRMQSFTWLDKELTSDTPQPLAPSGFGRTVSDALGQRRQWLVEQELAVEDAGGRLHVRPDLKKALTAQDWDTEQARWSRELGKPMGEVVPFERIDGQLQGKAKLGGEAYAIVERSRDFVLVPWRDVLENQIGKHISGFQSERGVDWTIGRGRDLGIGM